MLSCDFRIAMASEAARFGLTEAQAGVPFPLEEGLVDALAPFDALIEKALKRTVALTQPAFATVKKQVRGPLAATVAALAAKADEPFLDGFL
jgi:enoyl-CoA hydratase